MATRGGRLLTFATAAECLAAFRNITSGDETTVASGDETDTDQSYDPVPMDLGQAQAWVRRERLTVPFPAALNLWNWAIDVAYSTGRAFPQRSRRQDRCYEKLVAHDAPYLFELEEYRPIWSARQLDVLRATLGRAVHVVRAALLLAV